MHSYIKRFTSPTEYIIEQIRDDGYTRKVDENHAGFIEWSLTNTLNEINVLYNNGANP